MLQTTGFLLIVCEFRSKKSILSLHLKKFYKHKKYIDRQLFLFWNYNIFSLSYFDRIFYEYIYRYNNIESQSNKYRLGLVA